MVLSDFELAREMRRGSFGHADSSSSPYIQDTTSTMPKEDSFKEEYDDITASVSVSGTRGFMAPEASNIYNYHLHTNN